MGPMSQDTISILLKWHKPFKKIIRLRPIVHDRSIINKDLKLETIWKG